jgi:hypothetical protein
LLIFITNVALELPLSEDKSLEFIVVKPAVPIQVAPRVHQVNLLPETVGLFKEGVRTSGQSAA